MPKALNKIYRIIIPILLFSLQLTGQEDFQNKTNWELRLAPHYYFPSSETFYTDNGNYLRNRSGISGSVHLAYNLFFKKHSNFYLSVQGGIAFYPLYDFAINVKNSPIPSNSIPSPKEEIIDLKITPTYFDGSIEFHRKIFSKKVHLTGGLGMSVVRTHSDFRGTFADRADIEHLSLDSNVNNPRMTSLNHTFNLSDSRIIGYYNVGIRKFFTFQNEIIGIWVKWAQSFTPYSTGNFSLIRGDFTYASSDYKVYMKHLEFILILPL